MLLNCAATLHYEHTHRDNVIIMLYIERAMLEILNEGGGLEAGPIENCYLSIWFLILGTLAFFIYLCCLDLFGYVIRLCNHTTLRTQVAGKHVCTN